MSTWGKHIKHDKATITLTLTLILPQYIGNQISLAKIGFIKPFSELLMLENCI